MKSPLKLTCANGYANTSEGLIQADAYLGRSKKVMIVVKGGVGDIVPHERASPLAPHWIPTSSLLPLIERSGHRGRT